MSIQTFEFCDRSKNWTLKSVHFRPSLNLLVGVSGVGKSRLLNSLRAVCSAGVGRQTKVYGCEWKLSILVDDVEYTWNATTAERRVSNQNGFVVLDTDDQIDPDVADESPSPPLSFQSEQITCSNGSIEVIRTSDSTTFNGVKIPKTKDTESVISLFRDDESLAPLFDSLSRVQKSSAQRGAHLQIVEEATLQRACKKYEKRSVDELQDDQSLSNLVKGWVLQERFPDEFRSRISDVYSDVFHTVEEVRIDLGSKFLSESERARRDIPFEYVEIAIRERGVNGWVASRAMSSGMRRSLFHILELALSPRSSVMLIDEYENSMGVNCLPSVTNQILERARDLQFIVTSHHPYVIGNVDKKHWMLVRRSGCIVDVIPSSDVRSLDTRSTQDAFVQLMNAPEYRGE